MAFHQTQSTADASASIHMDALDPFVHELAASHEELLSHLEPLCQPHFKAAAFSPTSVEPHQLHSFAEQHMQTPWHYTGNHLMTRSQSADAFLSSPNPNHHQLNPAVTTTVSGGVAGLSASSSQTPSTSPELTYNAGDDEDDEDDDASDDDILEGTYIDPRNSRTASAAVAGKKATKRKYKRRAPLNQRFQSLPVPPTACGSVSVERASSIGPGSGSNGGGTKPRNYLCTHPGCGQEFLSSGHLVRHLRIHTQERPFKCSLPHCDMTFARSDTAIKHSRGHVKKLQIAGHNIPPELLSPKVTLANLSDQVSYRQYRKRKPTEAPVTELQERKSCPPSLSAPNLPSTHLSQPSQQHQEFRVPAPLLQPLSSSAVPTPNRCLHSPLLASSTDSSAFTPDHAALLNLRLDPIQTQFGSTSNDLNALWDFYMRGAIGPHHSSPQYPQQPTFVPETQIVLPPFAPAVESAQQTQSAAQEQQQLQGQQNQLQLMQTPNQLGYDMNGFIWMGGSVGFPGSFSVPPPSNSTSLMAHVNMSQSYSLPRMNFSACETPVGVNMGPYDFHAAFAATRQDQIQIQPQQQTEYQQAALTIPVAKVEPGGESPSTEPSTSSANADVAQQPWSDSVSPEIEPAETVGPELTVLLEGIPMLNPVVDFGTDLFEDPMFWDI